MQEKICNFGPKNSLFGILTTPDKDVAVAGAPTALIINAGIVHRIGPFRMHVDLARQLAEKGYSTLRIDLSGLGDSAPRTGKMESSDRAQLDICDAMDFLTEETGMNKFVMLGLCSGAYNAHNVSVKDDRIVGAVFMDGIVFRTLGYFFRHQVARLFRPRMWRNAIKRRMIDKRSPAESAGETLGESEFFSNDISKDKVIRDLSGMLKRGMQMLFLYTDGYDDICGRSQFKEMYGFRPDDGQLQVEYYPKTEHTFRLIENRKRACERVTNWFATRFTGEVLAQANH
ncbi:MAG: alpha/beta fold hydrolase [Mariniblastus sp.]